ncbi:MAG TPA: tRNA pseudouridine(55) synthase TruB [Flavobacteriales bacterium]|jgi:tRNA pseudouridine55 synthase|nr:tRNA pseudouridine(55) synthase TruB [Flavobacteriales bacterium]
MEAPFDPQAGAILLVDKPTTWSSFDVVKKIRGALRILTGHRIKVGHAGTLDPLASGLLVIGVGKFTKQLPTLTDQDKGYTATLKLGVTTPSYDAETDEADPRPWEHLTEADIRAALDRFTGAFQQRPPNFSAKRFQGERAYFLARDGAHVELEPHRVRIDRIDLLGIEGPEVRIDVACSKGTYIRSLAHDVGQLLGCGAYLTALRRTRSGPYTLEGARTPEEWSAWLDVWIANKSSEDQEVR